MTALQLAAGGWYPRRPGPDRCAPLPVLRRKRLAVRVGLPPDEDVHAAVGGSGSRPGKSLTCGVSSSTFTGCGVLSPRVLSHTPCMVLKADRAGRIPLHYAALEGRTADVVACLEEEPDTVNLADSAGFTPLHFAAGAQQAEAARVLIEAGAQVEARNKLGPTTLLVALMNVRDADGAAVRVLLDAGADPDIENNYGVSARSLAAKVANYDLMRFFDTNEDGHRS